ncbi:zinc-binding alcohol dehydrogenase family protein [Leifsonia sp. AG29]|uniref:zinc-binding alcohol dehydrogenase family protein n=1 Tax=Leifsonia sp. AG29 TaxID=2598860 RepID=UPI001E5CBD6C|nr:zinc-binding alcohol dehydrogenase family protein [Leifsonia sp. AG29]
MIDRPFADLSVRPVPFPEPAAGQLAVRVRAVAINPLDAIVQSTGRLMYGWLDYPAVLGEDVAGEVVAVGEGVDAFSVGDRVCAYAMGIEKGRDALAGGGFQHYVAVEASMTARLPWDLSFTEAAVLPLAFSTAAAALFERSQLGLDHSTLGSAPPRDEIVVIWGGATSVGGNAIQLARAAGYRVITTASPANHDRMRALGAEAVFDYRSPDVVRAITEAVGGSAVAGVVAIAAGSAEPCVSIAARTRARRVALTSPSVSFYDQPRHGGLSVRRARLLSRLVLSNIRLQAQCALHGIRARFVWGSSIADSPVGAVVWGEHLPVALETGGHRPVPSPRVIGSDLGAAQRGLDLMRQGVSAEKLVIALE